MTTGCKVNEIFLGEVASVQNYGAFVRIPGRSSQGLIHKSQISIAHVDDVAQVLQKGERVWCKVISTEAGKVGLSMKYVNQGNGTDLDPNSVQLQRDLRKKKIVGQTERKVIRLEAVLNTTCTKCGTAGHLSKDCFASLDGKKYQLIPETEPHDPSQAPSCPATAAAKQKKQRKERKSKKGKKGKRSRDDSEDSDSDEEDMEKRKRKENKEERRREKKRKKKKKKKDSKSEKEGRNCASLSDQSPRDSFSSHDVKAHKRKHSECVEEKRSKKCKHSKNKYTDE